MQGTGVKSCRAVIYFKYLLKSTLKMKVVILISLNTLDSDSCWYQIVSPLVAPCQRETPYNLLSSCASVIASVVCRVDFGFEVLNEKV